VSAASSHDPDSPHVPVLLGPLLETVAPVGGVWIDGTMGAGGYARGLLSAGAAHVIAIDRDPDAHAMALDWIAPFADRMTLYEGNFAKLDSVAEAADGVVLDLGVSSMQIDAPERGFSFQKDGPLDMRMSREGESAAEIVNTAPEARLADILHVYGEERAARRIARRIAAARATAPIETTLQLAEIVAACLPRPKPGQSHPATRSFQALRIAVNREYEALWQALMAAERVLRPGGHLAVVTFHSVEDRMVKRFFQLHGAPKRHVNRYAAAAAPEPEAPFEIVTRKAIAPDAPETAANPRARSAKLRVARRTDRPPRAVTAEEIAMPDIDRKG
jgi:16S rRNA (cytosine1402-N4)-methyltransferase